jgi:hypothetical protein
MIGLQMDHLSIEEKKKAQVFNQNHKQKECLKEMEMAKEELEEKRRHF